VNAATFGGPHEHGMDSGHQRHPRPSRVGVDVRCVQRPDQTLVQQSDQNDRTTSGSGRAFRSTSRQEDKEMTAFMASLTVAVAAGMAIHGWWWQ